MASFCICGICIPYSVIWPFVILILREIYKYFFAVKPNPEESKTTTSTKSAKKVDYSDKFGYIGYLTKDMDFDSLIDADKPTFVKFTAEWCKPCKQIEPYFEEFAKEHEKDAIFVSVDVDQFDEIAANNSAVTIPFFACFKKGVESNRMIGKDVDQLKEFIKTSLAQ